MKPSKTAKYSFNNEVVGVNISRRRGVEGFSSEGNTLCAGFSPCKGLSRRLGIASLCQSLGELRSETRKNVTFEEHESRS